MTPKTYHQKPIDFFARRTHFIDHLAPIWEALGARRGVFYVPECILDYAMRLRIDAQPLKSLNPLDPLEVAPDGGNPLVVAAYGDLTRAYEVRPQRPFFLIEHGVGLTPSNHSGYAGGTSLRRKVDLFLAPNEYIRAKTAKSLPDACQVVIGTPKLDRIYTQGWWSYGKDERMPVVAISFHWDGSKAVGPEAGNAFRHYQDVMTSLSRQAGFKLIGHGHPRIIDILTPFYRDLGVEVVRDFEEVMARADVYINDCSSTLYEFCVTGKPVIMLNAPWFRSEANWGIRFWDYTDIGIQVNEPVELLPAIDRTIDSPQEYREAREKAVQDLYPFLGHSAQRAAGAILGFCEGR